MNLNDYLVFLVILFVIGIVGFLMRCNVLVVFMLVELMFNVVNLVLVIFVYVYGFFDG